MSKSRAITFILEDGTDVFIDPPKEGIYHIRYIMPNGLPNVVIWSQHGKNDAFLDSNATEAVQKLTSHF